MQFFRSPTAIITAAFLCITLLAVIFVYTMVQPVSALPGNSVTVTVKPGMTASEIGTLLYQQGLIKNVTLFRGILHAKGLQNSLQAGEYSLSSAMNIQTIIGMLAKGEVAYREITIPEGLTIDEIAKLLEEKNLAVAAAFSAAAKDYLPYDYIQPSPIANYKPEGFLFPDTYRIPRGMKEKDLLQTMTFQFDSLFTPVMRVRAQEMGLSVKDMVILASLIEKEARYADERPIIARVFMNRLKAGMPLQSCATIQYILGYPKPELTIKDTEIPSPYNTYQNMGLPPGPIANPGMASIQAALFPADTDYLYFVADKTGKHHFSKTYDEHLANIEKVSY